MLYIGIPTYNRADWLELQARQIASAFAGDKAVVIRIFDNASTDSTSQLIRSLDPDLFQSECASENRGYKGNVRRILEWFGAVAAAEDWLWILSDDDIVFPQTCKQLPSALAGISGEACVLSWLTYNLSLQPEIAPSLSGLVRGCECLEVINRTALISNWAYKKPTVDRVLAGLRPEDWENSVFQMLFNALGCRDTHQIPVITDPVGLAVPSHVMRFNLTQTIIIDRNDALARAEELLGGDGSYSRTIAERNASYWAARAVAWRVWGDETAFQGFRDGIPEMKRRGLFSRAVRRQFRRATLWKWLSHTPLRRLFAPIAMREELLASSRDLLKELTFRYGNQQRSESTLAVSVVVSSGTC